MASETLRTNVLVASDALYCPECALERMGYYFEPKAVAHVLDAETRVLCKDRGPFGLGENRRLRLAAVFDKSLPSKQR